MQYVLKGEVSLKTHVYSMHVQNLCIQYACTKPMYTVCMYKTCVYSIHVQNLCIQYACTKPVYTVYMYKTCVYSMHVQNPCIQYACTKPVYTVYMYKTCVYSMHVQNLCIQYTCTKPVYTVCMYYIQKYAGTTFYPITIQIIATCQQINTDPINSLEQCNLTGGRDSSLAMSEFFILVASSNYRTISNTYM